jgi:hypothetical protein
MEKFLANLVYTASGPILAVPTMCLRHRLALALLYVIVITTTVSLDCFSFPPSRGAHHPLLRSPTVFFDHLPRPGITPAYGTHATPLGRSRDSISCAMPAADLLTVMVPSHPSRRALDPLTRALYGISNIFSGAVIQFLGCHPTLGMPTTPHHILLTSSTSYDEPLLLLVATRDVYHLPLPRASLVVCGWLLFSGNPSSANAQCVAPFRQSSSLRIVYLVFGTSCLSSVPLYDFLLRYAVGVFFLGPYLPAGLL